MPIVAIHQIHYVNASGEQAVAKPGDVFEIDVTAAGLPADSYRDPTDAELALYERDAKPAKAPAPKPAPAPETKGDAAKTEAKGDAAKTEAKGDGLQSI